MVGKRDALEGARASHRRLTLNVSGGESTVVIAARGAAREVARELGFNIVDQTRIATAVSEIVRNILLYAGKGVVTIAEIHETGRVGIEILAEDEGPGIEDIDRVLRGGYSTSGGFGRGIAGARALMDEFRMESQPGTGTRVLMRKWVE